MIQSFSASKENKTSDIILLKSVGWKRALYHIEKKILEHYLHNKSYMVLSTVNMYPPKK